MKWKSLHLLVKNKRNPRQSCTIIYFDMYSFKVCQFVTVYFAYPQPRAYLCYFITCYALMIYRRILTSLEQSGVDAAVPEDSLCVFLNIWSILWKPFSSFVWPGCFLLKCKSNLSLRIESLQTPQTDLSLLCNGILIKPSKS